MKRVVTGHDQAGKSVVFLEGEPTRQSSFPNLPGLTLKEIWATEANPQVPVNGEDPTAEMKTFIAPLGGTRFRIEQYPPDALLAEMAEKGEIDFAQAGAEFAAAMLPAATITRDARRTANTWAGLSRLTARS